MRSPRGAPAARAPASARGQRQATSEQAIGVLIGLGAAAAFEFSYVLLATQARRVDIVALATNSVAANWPQRVAAVLVGVLVVAVCGLTAVASESAALQRLPVFRVGPIVSGVQTTLPVLLAALLGDQRWGSAPGKGMLLAVGVLLVGAGASYLGSTWLRSHSRQDPSRLRRP